MTLLAAWSEIVADWNSSFPQQRTVRRAVRQARGSLVCLGRRCLSRIIWTQGGQQRSWSSEYFLHSRCRWEPQTLFAGVWRRALPYCPGRLVGVSPSMTPACARPAAPFPRCAITAIPSPLPFMST